MASSLPTTAASSSSSSSSSSIPAWANPNATIVQATTEIATEGPNPLLEPFSTLDEPVIETIMRDVRAVGSKLRVVLLPLDRTTPFGYAGVSQQQGGATTTSATPGEGPELGENERIVLQRLRDWDLWGPLLVCLTLSVLLSFRAPPNQVSLVFAAVFVAVWLGSSVITINAQLLGGTISFFQSLCVMGYCVFPMTVAAFVIGLFKLLHISWWPLNLVFCALGFVWATRASSVFIGCYIKQERRFLAVFPVLFFYTFLAWMILLF